VSDWEEGGIAEACDNEDLLLSAPQLMIIESAMCNEEHIDEKVLRCLSSR